MNIKYPIDKGKKHFQPKCINWSYLYRGRAARVNIKNTAPRATLSENQILPGIQFNKNISKGGNQPPKKRTDDSAHISNIFEYSPRKNKAKVIAEYSTL